MLAGVPLNEIMSLFSFAASSPPLPLPKYRYGVPSSSMNAYGSMDYGPYWRVVASGLPRASVNGPVGDALVATPSWASAEK